MHRTSKHTRTHSLAKQETKAHTRGGQAESRGRAGTRGTAANRQRGGTLQRIADCRQRGASMHGARGGTHRRNGKQTKTIRFIAPRCAHIRCWLLLPSAQRPLLLARPAASVPHANPFRHPTSHESNTISPSSQTPDRRCCFDSRPSCSSCPSFAFRC